MTGARSPAWVVAGSATCSWVSTHRRRIRRRTGGDLAGCPPGARPRQWTVVAGRAAAGIDDLRHACCGRGRNGPADVAHAMERSTSSRPAMPAGCWRPPASWPSAGVHARWGVPGNRRGHGAPRGRGTAAGVDRWAPAHPEAGQRGPAGRGAQQRRATRLPHGLVRQSGRRDMPWPQRGQGPDRGTPGRVGAGSGDPRPRRRPAGTRPAFVRSHGPVTSADFARWTGLGCGPPGRHQEPTTMRSPRSISTVFPTGPPRRSWNRSAASWCCPGSTSSCSATGSVSDARGRAQTTDRAGQQRGVPRHGRRGRRSRGHLETDGSRRRRRDRGDRVRALSARNRKRVCRLRAVLPLSGPPARHPVRGPADSDRWRRWQDRGRAHAVPRIRRFPVPAGVADALAWPDGTDPCVRAIMVATADGSARSPKGLSAGISSAADRLVFGTLRGLSDVILAGAETVRSENYGPPKPGRVGRRRAEAGPDHGSARRDRHRLGRPGPDLSAVHTIGRTTARAGSGVPCRPTIGRRSPRCRDRGLWHRPGGTGRGRRHTGGAWTAPGRSRGGPGCSPR